MAATPALTPPATQQRILYPKKEAAFALGISQRALDYLISDRRLTVTRIGKRTLIHTDELRKFARGDKPAPIRNSNPTSNAIGKEKGEL